MQATKTIKNKPIVIAVGIFFPGYSFTRVFESLFEKLSQHFSIHWLGIGYKGTVVEKKNYTLYPNNLNGGDMYGAYGAAALAKQLDAKTILLLNDFYMLKNYRKAWEPLKQQQTRLVAYVPLDGYIIDNNITADCFFLDELVLYHNDALQDVKKAIRICLKKQIPEGCSVPQLSYRYHGVDSTTFHLPSPADQQVCLKEKLFNVPDAGESIYILNANRFNERKDIATTITAFAKALPHFNKPAYLCLHTPNLSPLIKPALETLIENSGCKKNILLNPLGENYITDAELAQLYQACAIGVNTSFGEGWGMISFEHAACGAAQLIPAHTAPAEVWKNAGILIPRCRPVKLTTNPFQMYSVDEAELSNQLVKLVNDEVYLRTIATNCNSHTQKKEFSWEHIALQWKEIL
jgi:D-inositol-3-phosphate glycosyltransferase